ncbi:MAG: ribonuclease P protein component [bacterium]
MAISSVRFKLNEGIKLKDKGYINYIFKQGNKKPQKVSIIFYIESSRFKFLITFKKKLLNSARRNKFKRQIKEFIRLNQHNLKKIDCAILIAKIPASKIQLLKELEFLLTK